LEQPLRNSDAMFYKIKFTFMDTKTHQWSNFPLTNKWGLYYEISIGYKF
jgi:hypothetical protein